MSKATEALEKQADLLFGNIAGWETNTLEYIGARIKKTGKLSPADVKQLNNMAAVKQDMDEITKQLARVTGYNVSQIEKMYGDVIDSQHQGNKYLYDYRSKPFVPFSESRELQALVRAYAKSSAETMINISKTKALGFLDETGIFKDMRSAMYDALGKACTEVATGTTDFNTAMRRTIEALGGSGIRVDYGGGVTRSLESAVRANILWGAKQVSVEYNNMIGEELGCDGIEIDYHSNPRPSHEFMQGKQYSLEGKKTINGVTYESAERALARLEDYGCLHFKSPIILGISEPAYSEKELAELKRKDKEKKTVDGVEKSGYEWQQAMRRLESEARKEKNTIAALKAAGDEEGARRHRERLRAINKKYDSICEQTEFKPQKQRMNAYNKKKTAAKANNPIESLANPPKDGIINYRLVDRSVNIHNETDNGIFDIEQIENNLSQTNIGEAALKYIEQNNMFVTMNYDLNASPGVCGEVFGRYITIYPNNCSDLDDVCGTLIHEVAHKQYDWRYTQEDEVNCYLLEEIHKRGKVTEQEIRRIVDHVKANYTHKPKGEMYGF